MFLYLLYLFLHITSIFSSIQLIKVRENINVTITCQFDSIKSSNFSHQFSSLLSFNNRSDNIILWYKDDTQVIGVNSISNNPKKYIINQINAHTYQLTIINIQLESTGLYKCQNFTAKEENHFQINVIVPPSRLHITSSTQLPVIDGTLVSFNCTTERVYPNPIFEWYKNDKLIQSSIGNQTDSILFSSSSILTLLLTPADHNHILRCQVSNEASIDETYTEVKLDILFKPIINFFFHEKEITTNILTVIENTSEIIQCKISSNPLIIPNIEWYKNDQLILGEYQEQLRIDFVGIEKLSCRAKNTIGQTEANIDINILYKPKLSINENVTLNQTDKLVLKCLIDANPSCDHIRWLFNEKELIIQPCTKNKIAEYIIENIDRSQAGKYTCEVKNLLHTSFINEYDGISVISTYVQVQYAPYILNIHNKLAIIENSEIKTECLVDAYPKADIIWYESSDKNLNLYTKEKLYNNTIVSSELNLPSSYLPKFGLYRCVAKNVFGQHEYSIEFQRPGLPDPPIQLQVKNLTHSSFILNWQPGYNGGSEQIYHIILNNNDTRGRQTNNNFIRYDDLNENTRYIVKIRSKNEIGYSNFTSNIIITTKKSSIHFEEFPIIQQAYYSIDNHRIHFQISPIRSKSISTDQLCIQHYNNDEIPPCIPLNSFHTLNDELEIQIEQMNIRLKLCLINQTDICSKSIPIPTTIPLINESAELILVLTGGIIGLCIVFGLIGLFICIRQQRRKQTSKTGSTDTLKTNSENLNGMTSVRVNDTNSCLYYPSNQSRPLYYNDETTGVYSIQQKKSSICLDSGMPSTTSNNSDSAGSQALSSSDFYERSDGEHLVNGKLSANRIIQSAYTLARERENHMKNVPINERISSSSASSEEESGFSTPTIIHNGKKLVYEVVV
ncbi:unnamed protein product [Adineta steineri]|uniref:Uncharacterized protein n=1 Tax=Adineta steineri TaxID=433720 RepID=A0A818NMN1_9BILA|nr:unnamed protein product [Adineta steineri]